MRRLSVIALDEIGSTDVTDGVDDRFVNLMHDMDLMWANNEFCYSDRGERMPNKQFAFRAKTANVRYLADLGVDIAGLANNHVFDYGEQAFLDTLETLEGATDLQDEQTHGARAYIDAGADAIIGTHAHCLQGIEFYEGKPILYNLGNFWFDGFKGLTALAELQLPLTVSDSGRDECAEQDERAGRDGHGERGGLDVRARQGVRVGQGVRVEQDERNGQDRRGVDPSGVRLVLYPGWQQMAITSWIDNPTDRANAFRYIEDISVNATIDKAGFVSEA